MSASKALTQSLVCLRCFGGAQGLATTHHSLQQPSHRALCHLCRGPQHAETLKTTKPLLVAIVKLEVDHDQNFEGLSCDSRHGAPQTPGRLLE